ncbi:hypothetical protein BH24ACT3_BH24ACT3_18750 [soil metagenome]
MAHAELSTIATTLADLTTRVTEQADRAQHAGDEERAVDLYDVERSLQAAARRLAACLRRT